MDFNYVYKALQEVFPKVDDRILKAAAIENPKNANAAVEFVLSEALPFTRQSSCFSSSAGSQSSEESETADRINLLEDIIKNAKDNKTILVSKKKSVVNLMQRVKTQEKAAEHAREEASRGGAALFAIVEDMKLEAQKIKETNDMKSGEINGEKAILATELKELQSRALSLSYERDKSLAVLDEMLETLEDRLVAAFKREEKAKIDKKAKEDEADEAVFEQTVVTENMKLESARLEEEAEENSKLRELLLDRGHIIDMLQGEILGICDDVMILKEKVDSGDPLNNLVLSTQSSVSEGDSAWSSPRSSVSEVRLPPNSVTDGGWELCE